MASGNSQGETGSYWTSGCWYDYASLTGTTQGRPGAHAAGATQTNNSGKIGPDGLGRKICPTAQRYRLGIVFSLLARELVRLFAPFSAFAQVSGHLAMLKKDLGQIDRRRLPDLAEIGVQPLGRLGATAVAQATQEVPIWIELGRDSELGHRRVVSDRVNKHAAIFAPIKDIVVDQLGDERDGAHL